MNNGTLDRSTFEAIEAYVLDRMNALEREAFEQRIAADGSLRAEVELERENIRAVELGGVLRAMESFAQEHTTGASDRPLAWARYLKYAAMVALVATAFWWFGRPSMHERVFAAYYTEDPGLPVPMSISDDPVFHDAMVAYKLGDHDQARSKWATLLPARPTNDTLLYYMGCAALAGGHSAEAIPLFRSVVADSTSFFGQRARWYLFLSYVRTGDTRAREALDMERDAVYGTRAQEINERLSK